MKITGIGHAGLFIEAGSSTILCDPWVNPQFFGSWFPFPDNSQLDWDALGDTDYLYVSHLHRDHCDPALLGRHVRKDTTVLLPDYPTDELEQELRGLGFDNIVHTHNGQPLELDGMRVMITSLIGPTDGPIGDSALSVDDGTTVLLNQNDAHPLDTEAIREFGEVDAYALQFSGAIWWPMVYDLPPRAKQEFAKRKREGQYTRALRYIDAVAAQHVFPTAGPPCFLDDELFRFNGLGADGDSIFTDQQEFLTLLAADRPETKAHLLLPGSLAEVNGVDCALSHRHSSAEIERIFLHKTDYLRDYQARQQPALAAERAGRAAPREDLLGDLKQWWEPLLKRANNIRTGVGAPVRLAVGEDSFVIDFPASEVRVFDGESCRYRLSTAADLVATCVANREP
ncbi:MAG: MBL fold metallo-hydrolase, partial [Sciscionella sp.]